MPGGAFGSVALQVAVRHDNRAMVDLLLQSGASIKARSHWWAGSFGVLDDVRYPDMLEFLLARGAVMDPHDAANHGHFVVLQQLVEADPKAVHFRGGDGQTPLHVAPTVEIARYLLDHGAEIDALDVDHESTPAQYLIRDHQDVVRFLIERGARTDIMMLIALGESDRVRRMLDQDPSSIRTAVTSEFFPMKNPRAGGTIYNWTLDRYATVHQVARMFGRDEVLSLLISRTPEDLLLVDACERGDEAEVKQLAGRVVPSDPARLPFAAQGNKLEVVRLMLEAGWPVDARGQHQGTALHWAGFHGNAEMARLLIAHGANRDLKDADFDGTPLGWANYGVDHSWLAHQGDYPATRQILGTPAAP